MTGDEGAGERLRRVTTRPVGGIRALRWVEDAVRRAGRQPGQRERAIAEARARALGPSDEAGERTADPHGWSNGTIARRTAVATLVALGIVVLALALWKVRLIVSLLFLSFTIAAALRPGTDWLARHRVPRALAVLLHYVVLVGLVGVFLWLVVPTAIDQVQAALGDHALRTEAQQSTGIRHDLLLALDRRLRDLPAAGDLLHPAVEYGRRAFEAGIAVFFTFAAAAYWIFERERAIRLVCALIPRPKRRKVRDTWVLIDLKLGAYVRGQLVLVCFVATVLSLAFWGIGMPYWLLVGVFAGVVELVPVIGPLAAGIAAIAVGLADSAHVAVLAGLIVLGVRLLEDYLVVPRVLGHSVGLSPLVVLVSVTTVGVLFGGYAVILAIPIASVLATVVDVVLLGRDPAEEHVPAVIFPAKEHGGDARASPP